MQLRLSNGSASPIHLNSHPHLRKNKQQALFTYQTRDNPSRNVYYDTNPYFLHTSPSDPYLKTMTTTSRNSSRVHQASDVHSQRSGKVVRANGLKIVQKPSLSKPQEQSPVQGLRTNQQSRRMMQRELELQAQNKALRSQNQYLRERVRVLEEGKRFEVKMMEDKVGYLEKQTQLLSSMMESADSEWKEELLRLQIHSSSLN